MIFADKLINERKKNGWSQEDLAERLNVSRQSVSKWEGAQAVPDIQKIIAMADLFGVTTDYLLKDELEPQDYSSTGDMPVDAGAEPVRRVTLGEANEYLELERDNSRRIASGVSLCILSPVLLIVLSALAECGVIGLSTVSAIGIGVCVLLLTVAFAVFLFIRCGINAEPFHFLDEEIFETEYGIDGMVKEKKAAYRQTRSTDLSLGVILCILSALPLTVLSVLGAEDHIVCLMVGLLLILVAAGVNLLVRSGIIWSSYEKLLQENDYSAREKSKSRHIGTVSGIYWALATAIFLVWSFSTDGWDHTWILWPVAGVGFAVVCAVTKALTKEK